MVERDNAKTVSYLFYIESKKDILKNCTVQTPIFSIFQIENVSLD